MLVDVVLMRRDGVKLSNEAMQHATPVRGHLALRAVPWRSYMRPDLPLVPTVFASLHADTDLREPTLLPSLRDARIERLEGNAFVVVGIHSQGSYMREVDYPQAWACRLVIGQG
jgi:hypothetical protein